MAVATRHERILDLLRSRGYAGIDELVSRFGVTPQTIRRDLQEMVEHGLIRRHHGGASLPPSTVNTDYGRRHVDQAAEKERLAVAAVGLVSSGSSIFMTPGTTMEAVAGALASSALRDLRVVTNCIAVAEILGRNPNIQVGVTGGLWQANNRSLSGLHAVEAVARYLCDFALTSIGAIDPDGSLLEFRDEETAVARAMLDNARHRVLVADHTKFARVASCRLASIEEMTTLVTDRPPPRTFRRRLADGDCALVVAG